MKHEVGDRVKITNYSKTLNGIIGEIVNIDGQYVLVEYILDDNRYQVDVLKNEILGQEENEYSNNWIQMKYPEEDEGEYPVFQCQLCECGVFQGQDSFDTCRHTGLCECCMRPEDWRFYQRKVEELKDREELYRARKILEND